MSLTRPTELMGVGKGCVRPELDQQGRLNWRGAIADGTFGETRCGKGTKIMTLADRNGVPLDIDVASLRRRRST